MPLTASAANKEHEAIQRDIAMIGEEMRRLSATLTNEFTAMKTMVQQSINASDKAQGSVLVLETRMTERMQSLEKSLNQTVANMNAKVDAMADEFRSIKEENKETNARLLKMSAKMDELKNIVTSLPSLINQAPPQPQLQGDNNPPAQVPAPVHPHSKTPTATVSPARTTSPSRSTRVRQSLSKSENACEASSASASSDEKGRHSKRCRRV
jgi:chromosome segregation ATPase